MATVIDSLLINLGFDADPSGAASFDTGLGKIIKTAGKVAAAVGAAAGAIGAISIKTAANFEEAMDGVKAVSGATGEDFDNLREKAKKLGAETAFSASEAASGMEFLAMAGLNTGQILETIPNALNLAAAGGIDLARSADILSNIMTGMGLAASESERAADVLASTASSANVNIGMLGESMKYAAPIAKQLGLTLEETAATIGVMGNAGIQGSEAGTALRAVYTRLTTDKKAAKYFKDLGIDISDSSGKVKSMVDIFKDLEIASSHMTAPEKLALYKESVGAEAMSAFGVTIDSISDGSLSNLIEKLKESKGAASDMAATRMQGFNGQMKALKSAFEGLMIDLADKGLLTAATDGLKLLTKLVGKLAEKLPPVVAKIVSVFNWFEENAQRLINTLKVIGIVSAIIAGALVLMYAPAIAGFIAMKAAALVSFLAIQAGAIAAGAVTAVAWAIAFAPFLLFAVLVAGAIAWFFVLYKHWTDIWQGIKDVATGVADYIMNIFKPVIDMILWALEKITGRKLKVDQPEQAKWEMDDEATQKLNVEKTVEIDYSRKNDQSLSPDYGQRDNDVNNLLGERIEYGYSKADKTPSYLEGIGKFVGGAIDYSAKAVNKERGIEASATASGKNAIDYSKPYVQNSNQSQSTVTQHINVASANEAATIAKATAQGTRQINYGYR